jgi:hypothetical protein
MCFRFLAIAAVSTAALAQPRFALAASYYGHCQSGTQDYKWWVQKNSPFVYGVYADLAFGQDLQPCTGTKNESLSAVLPANIEGPDASQLVQVGIARLTGEPSRFYYTANDSTGGYGAQIASWYPYNPIVAHTYRFYLWQTEYDSQYGTAREWEYCILDRTSGHEACTVTNRTWGLGSYGPSITQNAVSMYETHDNWDQMGPPCCQGNPIDTFGMSIMSAYMGNRSWVQPSRAELAPYPTTSKPAYDLFEWMGTGTTWEAYTIPHS